MTIGDKIASYGIPYQVRGYPLIVSAIDLLSSNNMLCMTDIYIALASKYDVSKSSIERNMRTAVNIANKRNNTNYTTKQLVYTILNSGNIPQKED